MLTRLRIGPAQFNEVKPSRSLHRALGFLAALGSVLPLSASGEAASTPPVEWSVPSLNGVELLRNNLERERDARARAAALEEQIDAWLLRQAEGLPVKWLGEAITPAQFIRETDAHWQSYLALVAQNQPTTSPEREAVLQRKATVHAQWKRKRDVLLKHLSGANSGYTLRRFDGGPGESCGYVLMKGDVPHRSLPLKMNRKDPAAGDAVLPFPPSL